MNTTTLIYDHPETVLEGTYSVLVREDGDQSGRWLMRVAETPEQAARSAINTCSDHGYGLGRLYIRVYRGHSPTPVNLELAAEYEAEQKHGEILRMERL